MKLTQCYMSSVVTWPGGFAVLPIIHQLYFLGRIYETKLISDLKWCAIKTTQEQERPRREKESLACQSHLYKAKTKESTLLCFFWKSISGIRKCQYKIIGTNYYKFEHVWDFNILSWGWRHSSAAQNSFREKQICLEPKFCCFLFTVSDIANRTFNFWNRWDAKI